MTKQEIDTHNKMIANLIAIDMVYQSGRACIAASEAALKDEDTLTLEEETHITSLHPLLFTSW